MNGMVKAKVDRLAGKTYLVKKKHLKTEFSRRQIPFSAHFGRTWKTNYLFQVSFWGTPGNFGVKRFKLAMHMTDSQMFQKVEYGWPVKI